MLNCINSFLSSFFPQISRRIMRNCIDLNEKFYRADKPVLLTIAVDKNGSFNVSFMKEKNLMMDSMSI